MNKDIYANVRAVIIDIEGTISTPSFVKDILTPYVITNISGFIQDYEPEIIDNLDAVRSEEKNPDLSTQEVIEVLLRYIDDGENPPCAQPLQVMLLKEGYEEKAINAQVCEDALRALKRMSDRGISLNIYSSFSVPEQRLFFAHTQAGDITKSFDRFFDTNIGAKNNSKSYSKIAASIDLPPSDILFLSDNIEDIMAASNAGMKVIVMDRQACLTNAHGRRIEHDFDNILPEAVPA